jgi:hypothetical protein
MNGELRINPVTGELEVYYEGYWQPYQSGCS